MLLADIPSPSRAVFHLGPLPLRMYALCIILGFVVATWIADRRWVARGGRKGVAFDVVIWIVPAALVGARIYHVITDPELYWGKHGQGWVAALEIWHGGLGVWGGVIGGVLAGTYAMRRYGLPAMPLADAAAPGIAAAQAIGRWGNYFNQELYGRPTGLPWKLFVAPGHRPTLKNGAPDPHYAHIAYYHPTFLYESLWDVGVAVIVIWADRRFGLGRGRVFALYVAAYTAGRGWIESLRIDHANHLLGLRLNDWVSVAVFLGAVLYLWLRRGPREDPATLQPPAEPPVRAAPEPTVPNSLGAGGTRRTLDP